MFEHLFSFNFALKSECAEGTDISGEHAREAILRKLASMTDGDLRENIDAPFSSETIDSDK